MARGPGRRCRRFRGGGTTKPGRRCTPRHRRRMPHRTPLVTSALRLPPCAAEGGRTAGAAAHWRHVSATTVGRLEAVAPHAAGVGVAGSTLWLWVRRLSGRRHLTAVGGLTRWCTAHGTGCLQPLLQLRLPARWKSTTLYVKSGPSHRHPQRSKHSRNVQRHTGRWQAVVHILDTLRCLGTFKGVVFLRIEVKFTAANDN
jgi:hypothetical protein